MESPKGDSGMTCGHFINSSAKRLGGKTVTNIMTWNVLECLNRTHSVYNAQKLCVVSDATKNSYNLNEHKRHKTGAGYCYYVDTKVEIPKGFVRILETVNPKNGMTDYIYDPTWLPNLNSLKPIESSSNLIVKEEEVDKLIIQLFEFKSSRDINRLENIKNTINSWCVDK